MARTPKIRPALDLGAMEVTQVTERRTMAEFRRTRGERDAEQIAVDTLVNRAYEAWIAAGKPDPSNWVNLPGMFVRIAEAQLETIQYRIRKAGVHYDLRVRFGNVKLTGKGNSKVAEFVFTATERPSGEAPDVDEDEDDNEGEIYGDAAETQPDTVA